MPLAGSVRRTEGRQQTGGRAAQVSQPLGTRVRNGESESHFTRGKTLVRFWLDWLACTKAETHAPLQLVGRLLLASSTNWHFAEFVS